jgi:hypothetical protein
MSNSVSAGKRLFSREEINQIMLDDYDHRTADAHLDRLFPEAADEMVTVANTEDGLEAAAMAFSKVIPPLEHNNSISREQYRAFKAGAGWACNHLENSLRLQAENLSMLLRRLFSKARRDVQKSKTREFVREIETKSQHLLTPVSPLRTEDPAAEDGDGQ